MGAPAKKGASPSHSDLSPSSHSLLGCSTGQVNTLQCAVWSVSHCPVPCVHYAVLWTEQCCVPCVHCVLRFTLCCAVLLGSDAPLPHLPSLATKWKCGKKWGSFSSLQLPPPSLSISFLRFNSVKPVVSSLVEKLAESQLDANAVTSFWAQCGFHLDITSWPSSEVSSESSTPVMSS